MGTTSAVADPLIVDAHHDLLLLVARDRLYGEADSFRTRWIPEWRAAGVGVQVLPIHVETEYAHEGALRRTMQLIAHLHREVASNPSDVSLCATGQDIDEALADGKVALILAFEGSQAVGQDVELFELFFQLGLRIASFTWFGRTLLADGTGEHAAGGRLTGAGVRAFRELERLGILMDVSHLSDAGLEHVLELASRPVVATHSATRALADHPRNLTDRHLRAVAATGGVVGIPFVPLFIDPVSPTIDRVVDHIEHAVAVVGPEHVGIGTDFVRELLDEKYPTGRPLTMDGYDRRAAIQGLATVGDLPRLTETLFRRGFQETVVRNIMGDNFRRVFGEVIGRPQPAW